MRVATKHELKMLKGIIYLIRNKIDGKCYVGKTINTFEDRYGVSEVPSFKLKTLRFQTYLKNALECFGVDNFSIHILESNKNKEELFFLEEFYAAIYNCYAPNGYNLRKCGEDAQWHPDSITKLKKVKRNNPQSKKIVSSETKEKISSSLKEFYQDKNNHPWTGKKHSKESLEKMQQSHTKYVYFFISPTGILTEITNLRKFCRENNLNFASAWRLQNDMLGSCKGWTKLNSKFQYKKSRKNK